MIQLCCLHNFNHVIRWWATWYSTIWCYYFCFSRL